MTKTCHIFCRVIDNFGDIGVTLRLARQLVAEHHFKVFLWVDDWQSLKRLSPALDLTAQTQDIDGVELNHWTAQSSWQNLSEPSLVIEAFGCELPADYLKQMIQQKTPILWLNLEYLSAEEWVADCHALPSPQANGIAKYFFFPGFTANTGGLLREKHLIEQRNTWQQSANNQQQFLNRITVQKEPSTRLISLFSYETCSLFTWLESLSKDTTNNHVLIPAGHIHPSTQAWLKQHGHNGSLEEGQVFKHQSLKLQVIPFLTQDDYDRLLWTCDFNVVRGEDSFVRAQWAAKPFLWHIYPQHENVHLDKLQAFLQLYAAPLEFKAKQALESFWLDWNTGENKMLPWQSFSQFMPTMTQNTEKWCFMQANQLNLAQKLVNFHQKWLKSAT